jgi:hypothetical protein
MIPVHAPIFSALAAGLFVITTLSVPLHAYPYGIKPTGANKQDAMRQYESFMDNNVVSDNIAGGSLRARKKSTTSEYQGYAMAFAAAVGDEARFHKLWKFTKHFIEKNIKENDRHNFPWKVYGSNVAGPATAMDGCIEIVYGLDRAEEQWPGNGYGEAAKEYILKLLTRYYGDHAFWHPDESLQLRTIKPGTNGYHLNYMSMAWLPRMSERSGDPRFGTTVRETWYGMLEYSYENYPLPACTVLEDGTGNEGFCGVSGQNWNRFDAGPTRFGFRIPFDYLVHGEERAKKWAEKLTDFWIEQGAESDITNIKSGYHYTNGEPYGSKPSPTTISGAGVSAMAAGNQKIADGAWEYCKNYTMTGNCMVDGAATWGVLIMSGILVPAYYESVAIEEQQPTPGAREASSLATQGSFELFSLNGRRLPAGALKRESGFCRGVFIMTDQHNGRIMKRVVRQ